MTFQSVNPATEEPLASYPAMTSEEVGSIIARSQSVFDGWRRSTFDERSALMRRLEGLLDERKEPLARLMSEEMGKPLAQAEAEVAKCGRVCAYYAERAAGFLADETVETGEGTTFVAFEPLGILLGIMPWNFPLWQVFRFAVPAIMAGNAVVLKHAPNVPGSALEIEGLFRDAGFPQGLFRTLLIDLPETGHLIADPRIRLVSLTGSVRAGRAVAELAGRALTKTILELGGSDPYLVLEDADLELAVSTCVASRLLNSGQSCIAAKRFIVVEAVADEFQRRLVEEMRAKRIGDPVDRSTDLGPMARRDLRDHLHDQVTRSVEQGAALLTGGEVPDRSGFYYPPTVLTGVKRGMTAYAEELFGPVASIIRVQNEEEGIAVANDTSFGLGGAVFTRDLQRGREIAAHRIDSGNVFVNAFVKSDPRVPFGGVKESGYGRELSSFGIREYVNVKTVWIA